MGPLLSMLGFLFKFPVPIHHQPVQQHPSGSASPFRPSVLPSMIVLSMENTLSVHVTDPLPLSFPDSSHPRSFLFHLTQRLLVFVFTNYKHYWFNFSF